MSEDQTDYNSHPTDSRNSDTSNCQMELGTNPPLLIWIDTKVESTANKREHWTKASARNQSQKQAVLNAVRGLLPPRVPDANDPTP